MIKSTDAVFGTLYLRVDSERDPTTIAIHKFCKDTVVNSDPATLYLNPDNIAALLTLAELYLQQALPDAAQACYERVLTLRPAHRRAHLGVQRIATERTLSAPKAAALRGLDWLIPAPRTVLPRV